MKAVKLAGGPELDAIAYAISDNEAAKHMNEAKQKLFKTIHEQGKRVA